MRVALLMAVVALVLVSCAPENRIVIIGLDTTASQMASYCEPVAGARQFGNDWELFNSNAQSGCYSFFHWMKLRYERSDQYEKLEICPPNVSYMLQMVQVFRRYVGNYPSKGHELATQVAVDALETAFACKD